MIHAQIRTSILMTLSLILLAQVVFNPLLLSLIFALMILFLFYSLKDQSKALSRIWTFILTFIALAAIYFNYQTFNLTQ